MKRQAAFAVVFAVVVALITSATPVFSQSWKSSAEMSLDKNPNGDWSYGFIDKEGKFTLYNTIFDDGQGIRGWVRNNNPDVAGNVLVNVTQEPIDRYGVWWEPGKLYLQPGAAEQAPAVRWTAPADTIIHVTSNYSSAAYSTSSNVLVLRNGRQVLGESTVDGFAGKGMGRVGRTGASPERVYSAAIQVTKGDCLDFAVNHNGRWKLNQTAVDIAITVIRASKEGEPVAAVSGGFASDASEEMKLSKKTDDDNAVLARKVSVNEMEDAR